MPRDQLTMHDQMLQIQARISYPLEQALYQSPKWKRAKSVLDVGTGNGSYISLLAKDHPDKHFTSIEYDCEMANIAKARHASNQIDVLCGTCADLPSDFRFDFLLVRLSIGHLPDRLDLPRWAAEHANPGAEVLIIDTNSDRFALSPCLPLFEEAVHCLGPVMTTKPTPTQVYEQIQAEWTYVGFSPVNTTYYTIDSHTPSAKDALFITMLLTAELAVGSPLPSDLADELLTWALDPNSCTQQGMFATTFAAKESVLQQAFPTFQPIFEKLVQSQ